jgi:hypothetical protein
MTLFGWIRGRRGDNNGRKLDTWRIEWQGATAAPDAAAVVALTAALESLGLPEEEIEIEREMIEGLDQLVRLQAALAAEGLPIVETGHRVVGTDTCHFSAPSSMPDDPAQPSGRLILTGARAIFAGGARALTLPWHAVTEVVQQGRDVCLVRHDRETLHRFRCNVFADALCAALLSRTLSRRVRSASQESRKSREVL